MAAPLSVRVVLVVAVAATLVAAGLLLAGGDDGPDRTPSGEYVELDDGTVLWPYHSTSTNYATRTLPVNVVVYGNANATRRLLLEGGIGEWEELPADRQDVDPAEEVDQVEQSTAWGEAGGGARYIYLEPADGGPARWTDAAYHLHDGDYLGSRQHVRAYVDPVAGNWTAMQAHREHWDWFRLRHTVHSVADAQSHVEAQFLDRWYVDDLRREHFGNDRGLDADGWVTVVDLAEWLALFTGLLAVSVRTLRRRMALTAERHEAAVRALVLAAAVAAPYLFVRFGAIAVERAIPWLDPRLVVAAFHPILVVGVPVATYLAARPLARDPAFAVAALAFVVVLFVDYTVLGVRALPLDTFVYHAGVAAAVGFIAAGASRRARAAGSATANVRTGVLLWIAAGVLPLLRFVTPL